MQSLSTNRRIFCVDKFVRFTLVDGGGGGVKCTPFYSKTESLICFHLAILVLGGGVGWGGYFSNERPKDP